MTGEREFANPGPGSEFPIPYGRQWITEDDRRAVMDVLRSDFLTTGPAVATFERALAHRTGAAGAVAVSSGTAALHAAYACVGLGRGTELITTPLTFAATATTALHLGATVRFADVDDGTLTLEPEAVAAELNPSVRVVAPVDFAGHPADIDRLVALVEASEAVVVEDAAHALGSTWKGRPVGSIAPLTIFSFHPVKTITTGEGGAVTVAEPTYLPALRRFRDHGLVREPNSQERRDEGPWHQEVQSLGLNYRIPDILAALGTSQLSRLSEVARRRRSLAVRYHSMLSSIDGLRLPETHPDADPCWHLFAVRVLGGRRREVYERLREKGIQAQVHYLPVYLHPVFQRLGYQRGMCPVSERAYEELLSLPLFPSMTERQQDFAIESVAAVLR